MFKSILPITVLLVLLGTNSALARGAAAMGSQSIGLGAILTTPSQDDLDSHISTINSTQSTSISKFGTGYEFYANYSYRFSGTMFELQFRPSYFMQSTSGNSYNYSLAAVTFFPLLRVYPLENQYIHFYMQAGVGYGRLSGKLNQPSASVDFAGDAFGALAGLGAQFCADVHCFSVEGNLRYLPIVRSIAGSVSGTPVGFSGSTPTGDQELEYNNSDLKTTLSGIQGVIGYSYMF